MKIRTLINIVLVASVAQVCFAQNIKVLSEGANSTTIEIVPDLVRIDTTEKNGTSYLKLQFSGAVHEANPEGYYLKEFIPVMVGVFSRQIQVQMVQTDYETKTMMQPVRSPKGVTVLKPIPASEFVSYDTPVEQRRHIISRIRVYPFLYDSLTGSYRILKRVVFQVVSLGSNVTNQAVGTDRLLSGSLVNYSQVRDAVITGSVSAGGVGKQIQSAKASSVLAQGPWYNIPVSQSGIYKLTYQNLKDAKIPVDNISLSTIRIFNNGGTELPEDPNAARLSDPTENAIYVYNGNTDSTDKFESGDYILFYGKSPREWAYNSPSKTYHHYLNHYTEANYYFLTYGGQPGKRMTTVQSNNSQPHYVPSSFTCGIACDSELVNLQGSGKKWYGAELQPPSSGGVNPNTIVYLNKLTGLDSTQGIIYRASVVARSDASNYFDIYENSTGTLLWKVNMSTLGNYTDDTGYYAYSTGTPDQVGTGNLPDDRSALRFSYYSDSKQAQGYVNWFEILYQRKFQAANDILNFNGPDTSAVVFSSIQGFSSNNVKIFDVTDFSNVSMIAPASVANGTVAFGYQATAGNPRQFFAVGDNGYLSVSGITQIQNSDLRSQIAGADLIIVTPPDFISQANDLASFKTSYDGLKTIVVKTTDIYDEFSCGIPDPTAIRDYLKYDYTNFQLVPSYVILFGAGTYDYKNRVSPMPEFVPAYETDESLDQINSYCTDDFFVQFNSALTPSGYSSHISMAIGRLPARSADDATVLYNKIKQYESEPDYGSWRSLFTLVGDAFDGSGNPDIHFETTDAEDGLAPLIPPEIDTRKIYLSLYPTVVSTQGIRKPDAAADLVNQINDGTLVVNFVGHGAPDIWSSAHVFENAVTIPQLINLNKLSLFIGATCDFARDDAPNSQSGAELLVLSPKGGAIGVVSATRPVYDENNMDLNKAILQDLFVRDQQNNPRRIGEAMFQVEQSFYGVNDLKYQYVGDPSVGFGMPRYKATIDSLDGKSLAQLQQIRALSKVAIKGTIYHPDGTVWSDLSSTGVLTIYDSQRQVPDPGYPGTYYTFQGSRLFSGQVSVKGGRFEAMAVIPKDISYSDTTGRIEIYFQADGSDGSGYTTNVNVGGTDSSVVNNHIGPQLSIYFDSTNFKNGDVVPQDPMLIVDLHSDNGINLSDEGVGHALQATFDGQQSINLAPYYTGEVDSYQDGTVKYPVTLSLAPGRHTVTVSAFDVFNNSSEASADFDLESSAQLSLMDVYNYPDPFRSSTAFTFRRTAVGGAGEPVNVKIKVFTLSGRLIKTIHSYGETNTFVKINWDGLDDDGNRLANGVYLYEVIVSTIDGSQTSQAIGKMAVIR
jgi:hypothetical protein